MNLLESTYIVFLGIDGLDNPPHCMFLEIMHNTRDFCDLDSQYLLHLLDGARSYFRHD
jgi:hypothetical protein